MSRLVLSGTVIVSAWLPKVEYERIQAVQLPGSGVASSHPTQILDIPCRGGCSEVAEGILISTVFFTVNLLFQLKVLLFLTKPDRYQFLKTYFCKDQLNHWRHIFYCSFYLHEVTLFVESPTTGAEIRAGFCSPIALAVRASVSGCFAPLEGDKGV